MPRGLLRKSGVNARQATLQHSIRMLEYTFRELQQAVGGELIGSPEATVCNVSTDSRAITGGDDVLFVALVGARHDGHRFIEALYTDRRVRGFIVEHLPEGSERMEGANFLVVDNTLTALQRLGAYHRQRFQIPLVGITGSNGKTVVKEWLSQVLSTKYRTHHSPRSYNSQVGVPLSLLGLASHHEVGVYEAGISEPGEMEALERIIHPRLGIFTNLGQAHQAHFADLRSKGEEKMRLFTRCEQLIVCADQPLPVALAGELHRKHGVQIVTWSSKRAPCDMPVQLGEAEASGRLAFVAKWGGEPLQGWLPGNDPATVENALHTLLGAILLGIPPAQAVEQIGRLHPVAMRLERRESVYGHALINDSYSCDIESLQVALAFLHQQAGGDEKAVILSDIQQSGLSTEALYQQVHQLLRQYDVKTLIGVGPDIASLRAHMPEGLFYPTTQALLEAFPQAQLRHAAVLVKGSRSYELERASHLLEKQAHRTVLEVSLTALEHNLNHFRSLLAPGVRLFVLVKAFAYGNGSCELARLLTYHQVDYLGVAFADEGVVLRNSGVSTPIVVLNPAPDSYALLIEHGLEPEIFSFASLRGFSRAARELGAEGYPVHLKFDTGMHRVGFSPEDVDALIGSLAESKAIRVASMFTHLAAADEPGQDEFTAHQVACYTAMADSVERALGYRPLRHVLNSAGTERFPDWQFDMVRLGIGLHGISVYGDNRLQVAASLKTYVAQVKHLNPGDTVGYGRKGRIEHPATIATLPIGYADGFNRRLGNGVGHVLVKGHLLPTIGNICMDTCMVDASGCDVREGDSVTIFGPELRVERLAQWLGTIPYEVMSTISSRVSRLYYTD